MSQHPRVHLKLHPPPQLLYKLSLSCYRRMPRTVTFYLWKRKLTGSIPAKLTPAARASAQPAFLQVQTTSECFLQVKLLSGVVIAVPMEALDSLPLILERIA